MVDSMFIGQGKDLQNGYSIEMDGTPRFLVVRLYDDKEHNAVEISINGVPMGKFRPYSNQGYKLIFEQRYRVGMRNGLTSAERYMEDTCKFYNDTVLLQKAYH